MGVGQEYICVCVYMYISSHMCAHSAYGSQMWHCGYLITVHLISFYHCVLFVFVILKQTLL